MCVYLGTSLTCGTAGHLRQLFNPFSPCSPIWIRPDRRSKCANSSTIVCNPFERLPHLTAFAKCSQLFPPNGQLQTKILSWGKATFCANLTNANPSKWPSRFFPIRITVRLCHGPIRLKHAPRNRHRGSRSTEFEENEWFATAVGTIICTNLRLLEELIIIQQ